MATLSLSLSLFLFFSTARGVEASQPPSRSLELRNYVRTGFSRVKSGSRTGLLPQTTKHSLSLSLSLLVPLLLAFSCILNLWLQLRTLLLAQAVADVVAGLG